MTAVRALCVPSASGHKIKIRGLPAATNPENPWLTAEDRGFEPRRVSPPNRISRPLTGTKASVTQGKLPESVQLRTSARGNPAKPGGGWHKPSRASIVPSRREWSR